MDYGLSVEPHQENALHPELVAEVRQKLLPLERANEVGSLFTILKDPTRLQVVYALLHVSSGELSVSDLAIGLGRDDTTISHQLRVLRNQRIVTMRRSGRIIYYRLIDEHIQSLLELALSHVGEKTNERSER